MRLEILDNGKIIKVDGEIYIANFNHDYTISCVNCDCWTLKSSPRYMCLVQELNDGACPRCSCDTNYKKVKQGI